MGRTMEQTNAAKGEPASQGDACHAQADEDCELVVDVAVDGLECEQQEDFESHQRESGCGRAGCGGGTAAMLAPGDEGQQRGGEDEENEECAEDPGERNLRGGAEPAG